MADKPLARCAWVTDHPLYIAYHDHEWGVPVHDDRRHFEFLVLETAQAGLSWFTVLRKREAYREVFCGFDPAKVARFGTRELNLLLQDARIIRNRRKLEAAIHNARAFLEVQDEFGSFDAYCWRFVDGKPRLNRWRKASDVPVTTPEAMAWSKDLKKRGFKFVGPTVIYAHMQAVGMVNDHTMDCFRYHGK